MTYTSHGWYIRGTVITDRGPATVAKCGGPGICQKCSVEAYKALSSVVSGTSSPDKLAEKIRKEGVEPMSPVKTIEPKTFQRKPFEVQAVQVTEDNFEAVAEWCGGKIVTVQASNTNTLIEAPPDRYIQVLVSRPMSRRQTEARLGDWILYASKGFKVYGNRPFIKNFDEKNGGSLISLDDSFDAEDDL